jgi:hypothetical protein
MRSLWKRAAWLTIPNTPSRSWVRESYNRDRLRVSIKMSNTLPTASTDGRATVSMVLGLCSGCLCIAGFPAVIVGVTALPGASPAGKTRAYIGIGTGIAGTVFWLVATALAPPPVDTSEPAQDAVSVEVAKPEMPTSQQKFCDIVTTASKEYSQAERSGANELKLSKLRHDRAVDLRDGVKDPMVEGWIATVDSLSTLPNGDAVFVVKLPCGGIKLTTGGGLDIGSNEIPLTSPLFSAIADLETGSSLRVSGELQWSSQDGYQVDVASDFSEAMSMWSPAFLFKFTAIGPP